MHLMGCKPPCFCFVWHQLCMASYDLTHITWSAANPNTLPCADFQCPSSLWQTWLTVVSGLICLAVHGNLVWLLHQPFTKQQDIWLSLVVTGLLYNAEPDRCQHRLTNAAETKQQDKPIVILFAVCGSGYSVSGGVHCSMAQPSRHWSPHSGAALSSVKHGNQNCHYACLPWVLLNSNIPTV